jgi:hypothetical protein
MWRRNETGAGEAGPVRVHAPVGRRQTRRTANLRVGLWRRDLHLTHPSRGCSRSQACGGGASVALEQDRGRRSRTSSSPRSGGAALGTEILQLEVMLRARGARLGSDSRRCGSPLGIGHLGLSTRDPHPLRHSVACTHHPSGLRPSGIEEATSTGRTLHEGAPARRLAEMEPLSRRSKTGSRRSRVCSNPPPRVFVAKLNQGIHASG